VGVGEAEGCMGRAEECAEVGAEGEGGGGADPGGNGGEWRKGVCGGWEGREEGEEEEG